MMKKIVSMTLAVALRLSLGSAAGITVSAEETPESEAHDPE